MPIGLRTIGHNSLDFTAGRSHVQVMTTNKPAHFHSSGLEKVLEHRFIAELTNCLWLEGCRDFEVLRSEVDANGYDLVVDAKGVLRHIQLKSMRKGGKKQHVSVNMRLAAKPAGCVVWYDYDPDTLRLGPFRWFGSIPGLGLPDTGEKVARHSKGDATGAKNAKPGHRVLRKSKFTAADTIADLVPLLFGRNADDEIRLLQQSLSERPDPIAPDWVREVFDGKLNALPDDLRWSNSVELVHLAKGYDLAANLGICDPFDFEERQLASAAAKGRWHGGPAILWTTLFLEHRRWRFASPQNPDPEMELLLDGLCGQLVTSLKAAQEPIP